MSAITDEFLGNDTYLDDSEGHPVEAPQKPQEQRYEEEGIKGFLTSLKAPKPREALNGAQVDPIAQAARETFKGMSQRIDSGGQEFAAAVRKASGGFDAVELMRQIRKGQ